MKNLKKIWSILFALIVLFTPSVYSQSYFQGKTYSGKAIFLDNSPMLPVTQFGNMNITMEFTTGDRMNFLAEFVPFPGFDQVLIQAGLDLNQFKVSMNNMHYRVSNGYLIMTKDGSHGQKFEIKHNGETIKIHDFTGQGWTALLTEQ